MQVGVGVGFGGVLRLTHETDETTIPHLATFIWNGGITGYITSINNNAATKTREKQRGGSKKERRGDKRVSPKSRGKEAKSAKNKYNSGASLPSTEPNGLPTPAGGLERVRRARPPIDRPQHSHSRVPGAGRQGAPPPARAAPGKTNVIINSCRPGRRAPSPRSLNFL